MAHKHLFLALCFAAVTAHSYLLFDIPLNIYYTAAVFFSALSLYNYHRLKLWSKVPAELHDQRHRDAHTDKGILILLSTGGAFGAIALFVYGVPMSYYLPALPGLATALAYTLPLLPGKKRLRDVPYAKLPVVAFACTWITAAIPLMAESVGTAESLRYLLWRCCFMAAITLPFDVRDREIDLREGVKTLAGFLSVKSSNWLSVFLLFVYAVGFLGETDFSHSAKVGALITALTGCLLALFGKPFKHSNFFYAYGWEGLMLLELLCSLGGIW